MKDIFGIVPEQTVQCLNTCLDVLFSCQTLEAEALEAVRADPGNAVRTDNATRATAAVKVAKQEVEAVEITPVDLIVTFQDLPTATIRQSNR